MRASSVGRARPTLSVGVGRDWAFTKESVENANSRGYIGFLGRLSELVGKVHAIDDNAGCHTSKMSAGHIKDNAGRLRRTSTLPHASNDNAAEPQIRAIKAAMSNVGPDGVGAISSGLKWCFENGLISPVKPYDYAMVDSPRISPRKAGAIKKRLEPGEHFVHVRRVAPGKEIRPPAVDELGARDEGILRRKSGQCCPHTGQLEHPCQLSCKAPVNTACIESPTRFRRHACRTCGPRIW